MHHRGRSCALLFSPRSPTRSPPSARAEERSRRKKKCAEPEQRAGNFRQEGRGIDTREESAHRRPLSGVPTETSVAQRQWSGSDLYTPPGRRASEWASAASSGLRRDHDARRRRSNPPPGARHRPRIAHRARPISAHRVSRGEAAVSCWSRVPGHHAMLVGHQPGTQWRQAHYLRLESTRGQGVLPAGLQGRHGPPLYARVHRFPQAFGMWNSGHTTNQRFGHDEDTENADAEDVHQ